MIKLNMQRYSDLFGKTRKDSKKYDSINATLLIKAGFIDQLSAGIYTYLPMGKKVLFNIENIVREEMDKIADEILMPSLAPKDIWEKTGRINTIDVLLKAVDAILTDSRKEYILNPSHEEIVTPLAQKYNMSYKDFPFALYQIQTKFRNEKRAKSGLLRGREFRMKDLYSFHTSRKDLNKYFEIVKQGYWNIFRKIGIEQYVVEALASGGDFTDDRSIEFQVKCDNGEDTIYHNLKTGEYFNEELINKDNITQKEYEIFKGSEAANIFKLDTKYTDAFEYTYKDKDNTKKQIYMGCYGIGISRLMGILVEIMHDDNGIIWSQNISPYDIYFITNKLDNNANTILQTIMNTNKTVLLDDREIGIGEKLKDADLVGIPIRLVLSDKSIRSGGVEFKIRNEDKTQIIPIDNIDKFLK